MRIGTGLIALMTAFALLAGCQDASIDDLTPKADRDLPKPILAKMEAKGMTRASPVMMRIFKDESTLEVWKQKDDGRYGLIAAYKICKWSGKLGPKKTEGDRQAPEGFYYIHPWQMNPQSHYYLSFNIGYPNAYDRAWGRTGSNLMIHGACSSAGCYSMTDENVAQIYAFARDALDGGQKAFLVEAFPFRMTAENMAKHRNDPNFAFWQMLKPGYDDFEITRVPPKVDVCDRKYVVDVNFDGQATPRPTEPCPPSSTPAPLLQARAAYNARYQIAFDKDVAKLERTQQSRPATAIVMAPASAHESPATAVASANRPASVSVASTRSAPVPRPNREEATQQQAKKRHWWSAFSGEAGGGFGIFK